MKRRAHCAFQYSQKSAQNKLLFQGAVWMSALDHGAVAITAAYSRN
jgi:hypothetical protein